MNLSQASAAAALNAVTSLCNGGTLKMYSGAIPTSPETALGAQTLLATWTFSGTAFGSSSFVSGNEQEAASFAQSSVTPVANGTACFARVLKSDGTTVVGDLIVSAPWVASASVIIGQYVSNSGNLYVCTTAGTTAASGGPTGTGSAITDGTAVWKYIQAGTGDISWANTSLQTTINANLTSLLFQVPAV